MLKSILVPLLSAALLAPLAQAGTLPRPAGEFAIGTPAGKPILLSQYKGKVVALMFFLTYCSHCQKITSFLIEDQNQYGPRGFQVLGSAVEEGAAAAVPGFVKKFNPPFPVGYNVRGPVLDFLQRPVADRLLMPQLVFIDRQGVLREQYSGESPFLDEAKAAQNLRSKIEELLRPAAPAAPKKRPAKTN
jgi:thiol-disulfide isomerase/thioredoxin